MGQAGHYPPVGHSICLQSTAEILRRRLLVKGRACLLALLERFGCLAILLSEPFEDGLALLRVAERRCWIVSSPET
jgi:hypothetical protein